MDVKQLEALLADLESDRAERTLSLNDPDKFSEAICAFANDMPGNRKPGYLFVGATPDGSSSGAGITDQVLQNLAAIRSNGHIQPLPALTVEELALGGGQMAVVEVQPSDMPPVRYKGVVRIRVGPRRGIANEQEERILTERRVSAARTWDARPALEAAMADLVLDLFTVTYRPRAVSAAVIQDNHRSVTDQLAALRFLDPRTGSPTNAGVILFAADVLRFCPGAYVEFVEYDGLTAADPVRRNRRISGDLLSVMRRLEELAQELANQWPVRSPGSTQEATVFVYPPVALHELLMNAVIHRNYDGATAPIRVSQYADRIEITNPGGLYGELIPESFPRETAYRNPVIAEAARTLGYVNRFGRGIIVAKDALERNGSPPPVFKFEPNYFFVEIGRHP